MVDKIIMIMLAFFSLLFVFLNSFLIMYVYVYGYGYVYVYVYVYIYVYIFTTLTYGNKLILVNHEK